LLSASIIHEDETINLGDALNDVVLYAGEVARMLEFELSIDGDFVYSQRSDGLIMATPTGSTAYALSGGGPIMHPTLEAIVLVPMFPHTLTSRPIVVNSNALIELRVAKGKSEIHPGVSCDGQDLISLSPGAKLQVKRKDKSLRLIHPADYDYYHTLRTKLEWGSQLKGKYFSDSK
jgi:NAD+ kinase